MKWVRFPRGGWQEANAVATRLGRVVVGGQVYRPSGRTVAVVARLHR